MLIKYIKSVLWRVAKRLSYIEDARCLKVNEHIEKTHVYISAAVSCFVRAGQQKRTERLYNQIAITDTLLRDTYHIHLFGKAAIDLYNEVEE